MSSPDKEYHLAHQRVIGAAVAFAAHVRQRETQIDQAMVIERQRRVVAGQVDRADGLLEAAAVVALAAVAPHPPSPRTWSGVHRGAGGTA